MSKKKKKKKAIPSIFTKHTRNKYRRKAGKFTNMYNSIYGLCFSPMLI